MNSSDKVLRKSDIIIGIVSRLIKEYQSINLMINKWNNY